MENYEPDSLFDQISNRSENVLLPMKLTDIQNDLLNLPLEESIFLHGEAGTGKTTVATNRLIRLLEESSNDQVLVLTPQRSMASIYQQNISDNKQVNPSHVSLLTMGSLVRRMVSLFWPLFSENSGFHWPYRPPQFLTLETAQYYMGHLVSPLLDQGYFSTISIKRHRLYSQLIDNLNKSAVVGFPYQQIGERLSSAWVGDSAQLNVYQDVQTAINLFRDFCLQNNLLDFSLQVELFRDKIWNEPVCRRYMAGMFQHLIYDNCEEDPPYVHAVISEWLPSFHSSMIIYDEHSGFRRFLGADPDSAFQLQDRANKIYRFDKIFTSGPEIQQFKVALLGKKTNPNSHDKIDFETLSSRLTTPAEPLRFFPQVLDYVAHTVHLLGQDSVPYHQIAVLSPYVSDSLQFSLRTRLAELGIPSRVLRPSVPLKNDPVIQCLLTLSQAAHPTWDLLYDKNKLVNSLVTAIEGLDALRATILADKAVLMEGASFQLLSFSSLPQEDQARVTSDLGHRYNLLQTWLQTCDPLEPLDVFLSRLFGEVLSQPGFGFHQNLTAGQSTANLIESFRKFRWSINSEDVKDFSMLSQEYVRTVQEGIISAQYLSTWQKKDEDSVLIAPALTFLIQNESVDYQIWLNVGSPGWYERLEQPLTHPYVLSRAWQYGDKWTAEEEAQLSAATLDKMVIGLLNRCRKQVILGVSEYNEAGIEERGLLLTRIQNLYRQTLRDESHA